MASRFGEWVHVTEARVPSEVLGGRSTVVIPIRSAAVCGEDHVYDSRVFHACPNCASEERIPLYSILGRHRAAPPAS